MKKQEKTTENMNSVKDAEKVSNSNYVSETIRRRPINRRKLLRRTITTIVMAIIFGAIACITFIYLEPVISDRISPEEITRVELPETEDEVAPEELLTEDSLEKAAIEEEAAKLAEMEDEVTQNMLEGAINGEISMKAYQTIYEELYSIAKEASKSLVIVTGVSQETDWFLNEIENINETSGVIVALNDQAAYIVADINGLTDAESYRVIFNNGEEKECELKARDTNTGLAVFTVPVSKLPTGDDAPRTIAFSGSVAPAIVGRPVIAVGSPLGQSGSVCYGIVTSNNRQITYADYDYDILTTDITGSGVNASGILVNTSGNLLGIITKESTESTSGSLITAFGISGIRNLIEQLSNQDQRIYIGIHGAEVTERINATQGIPIGIYVTDVDVGSPAMEAGVAAGDVITRVGTVTINGKADYHTAIKDLSVDEEVGINFMRFNGTEFVNIEGTIRTEAMQ